MKLYAFSPACRSICLAAIVLLTACTAAPPTGDTPTGQAARAQQASNAGRHEQAAELWMEAAHASQAQVRHEYFLQAAEAWSRAGRMSEAADTLTLIDDQQLSAGALSSYSLLQAEQALLAADAAKADFYLRVALTNLAGDQQLRYQDLRARVERLRTNPASYALAIAARAIAAVGRYETSTGVALLQLFEDVPSSILQQASSGEMPDMTLEGWPALALYMRQTLISGVDLQDAAAGWAGEHPGHAVSETGFLDLAKRYGQLFRPPSQIAVLLPFEGGLSAAGAAIRDGLVGAFLENPQGTTLRFYATADDPQSSVSAYFQAVSEGAQWIIGPLRRESVQALAGLGSLGVPALVLNNVVSTGTAASDNLLFSLSLSQEDEARAIARRVLANGGTSAITLVVDNAWGERMEATFIDELTAGQGTIAATARFSPTDSDHSGLLTQLLEIEDSRDRKNRLQATLNVPLVFEPTRRDDFDIIFLAAGPEQGRQIRPQLRFYDAGDKEVFAMGRIYSGVPDPAADRDLNGVVFPSTAWQRSAGQDKPMPGLQSLRGGSLGNLYALGLDAWNLIPWLPLMKKDMDLGYSGAVGSLWMSQSGELLREPAWAVFSGGLPSPAQWPQREN